MHPTESLFLLRERIAEAEQIAAGFEREGRELLESGGAGPEVELRRFIAGLIHRRVEAWREEERALRSPRLGDSNDDETRVIDPRAYRTPPGPPGSGS